MKKIQKIVIRILLLTSVSLLLSANAEAVDNSGSTDSNTITANAGTDRTHTVTVTNKAVHLVSIPTASIGIVSYKWYKDGTYIGPNESRWHVLLEEGVHEFELIVSDSDGNTGSDTVEITVVNTIVPRDPFVGTAPTASNIFMTGIPTVGETLTLNYTFEDEDGDSEGASIIVWSTPTVELQRGTSKTYTIPAELEGELIGAYLHVIDENGVEMERTYDYAATNNTFTILPSDTVLAPLTANAGVDKTLYVTSTNRAVNLMGTGTSPDDSIVSYKWYFNGTLISSNASTWYTFTENGTFTFTLEVTDASANTATDTMSVTVTNTENHTPTVSNVFMTGTAKSGETLTVNYTFEDEDGDSEGSSTTVWSSNGVELQNSTSTTYLIPANLVGEEISVQVIAMDEHGLTMALNANNNGLIILPSDVTVVDTLTANAGDDKILNITASNNAIHLMGTATDSNNNVVSYKWYKGELLISNGASLWYVLTENGVHEFRLVVEDADGNTATDTMIVTVNNGVIPELTVDAGSDQSLVLSGSNTAVYLSGTATDTNNNIVSYKWYIGSTFIGDGASRWYTMNTVGTYTLTLVVEDADGNVARDTMTVTVE
ncbi:MAG TPA: PKD domain-containing protein [Crocinitomix sp.]|nr:PKD domain-containing protein [Crocinitomix sp.]